MSKHLPSVSDGEFLLCQTEDGQVRLDVRLQDETVWLTQPLMAELFQTTQQNISQHIRNVFEEGELTPEATHKKFLSVRREGKRNVRRELDFYKFDMGISDDYRVNSIRGTQFCIWATQRLREYIIKGFALDDERLKEAVRSGFKKAWQESNCGTIIAVARKMQENVILENLKLLMRYDQALIRSGEG